MQGLLQSASVTLEGKAYNNCAFQVDLSENYYGNGSLSPDSNQTRGFEIFWSDLSFSVPKRSSNSLVNAGQKLLDTLKASKQEGLSHGLFSKSKATYNVQQMHSGAYEPRGSGIEILSHLNGSIRSGQLTGIIGPSGAGKTSLLNILSRRREHGFTGRVRINSNGLNLAGNCGERKIKICSIPQHDTLAEYLTVRENLTFASRLTNPDSNHEKNVLRISSLLGLEDCLDTMTKNISGGQQKRLSITQELFSQPDILILDEPTSGLDSSTCIKTLAVLMDLVQASMTGIMSPIAILLTIHQPQKEAFDMFDKVYVMASGGVAIYNGPPDRCAQFVSKHAGIMMPSIDYNPASFVIEIASGQHGKQPIERLEQQVRQEFEKSELATPSLDNARLVRGSEFNNGRRRFWYKTGVLTERWAYSIIREPIALAARIIVHFALPITVAILFRFDIGRENACPKIELQYPLDKLANTDEYVSPNMIQNFMSVMENMSFLFIILCASLAIQIGSTSILFALNLRASLREYYNGWYPLNSYLFSRFFANLPLDIVLPTITISLAYLLTGQNIEHGTGMPIVYRIMISSLGMIFIYYIGALIACIVGTIYVKHMTTAIFISQSILMPSLLLSGFTLRCISMPWFSQIISEISIHKHCANIILMARYGWNVCPCEPSQFKNIAEGPKLLGVPEKLSNYLQVYMAQSAEQIGENDSSPQPAKDMFKLIAKQVYLFNAYGVDVQSCKQVVPLSLVDMNLNENDIMHHFKALFWMTLILMLAMCVMVKITLNIRSSL